MIGGFSGGVTTGSRLPGQRLCSAMINDAISKNYKKASPLRVFSRDWGAKVVLHEALLSATSV
jgi:hypothetical protein